MRKDKLLKIVLVFTLLFLFTIENNSALAGSPIPVGSTLPKLFITSPDSQESRNYLGIQNSENFTLSDVSAKLIIIEFFSTFCPVCHAQAPVANSIHKLIQGDPTLKDDIKMIGIALGNPPEMISAYSNKYNIPFPLIADMGGKILSEIKVEQIPQTLLLDKKGKVLVNHPGIISNLDIFLNEIRNHLKNQQP